MRVSFQLLALGVGLVCATPALAQAPAATTSRISGVVETLTSDTLVLKASDSRDVSVALPADTRITALANRKLSDIKPGDFVGSAAMKGMDGKLHAQEVHIFPEALRGTGEGHRPMAQPDQTMTNATVAVVAATPKGQVLTLNYNGGTQEIDVGPDARIVTFIAGDRSLLKPGATVVVSAIKAPDGGLTARSIQAEKDGVMPLIF
jgi:hypothetical protein